MKLYGEVRLVAAHKLWRDAETEILAILVEVGRPEWDWTRVDWLRRLRPAGRGDQARAQSFREGTRRATELEHPNIVQVLEGYDLEGGDPVQHMECVLGHNLGDLLEKQRAGGVPFSRQCASQILCEVETAVRYAHNKDVFHGGICANEIWVRLDDGQVKVAGFGVRGDSRHYAHEDKAALGRLRSDLLASACGADDGDRGCHLVANWALKLGGPRPVPEFAAAGNERHAGLPEGSWPED